MSLHLWLTVSATGIPTSRIFHKHNAGSDEALGSLLQANVHHAFLYAISHFTPTDSNALRSAFSRGLRALAASIAEIVGPSMWGLRPEKSSIRNAAQQALSYLFQVRSFKPSRYIITRTQRCRIESVSRQLFTSPGLFIEPGSLYCNFNSADAGHSCQIGCSPKSGYGMATSCRETTRS